MIDLALTLEQTDNIIRMLRELNMINVIDSIRSAALLLRT